MPSTTPGYKLPYPLGTDPVADGDDAIKALAEKLEAVMGAWTTYTPTFTAMTFNTHEFRWRRSGQTIQVQGSGKLGAAVAGAWQISLPAGHAARMLTGVAPRGIGTWYGQRVAVSDWSDAVVTQGSAMSFVINSTGTSVTFNTPVVWQINDIFTVDVTYETLAAPL